MKKASATKRSGFAVTSVAKPQSRSIEPVLVGLMRQGDADRTDGEGTVSGTEGFGLDASSDSSEAIAVDCMMLPFRAGEMPGCGPLLLALPQAIAISASAGARRCIIMIGKRKGPEGLLLPAPISSA
ncbi:MAG: hypothetical protein QM676_12665 [Novosphingobium sp.]